MNLKRKFTILLIVLMTPLLMGASYNYSFFGEVLHSSPGYNYITHFDQQTLGNNYTDPSDFKVYNDHIYLLARNADRTKDVLLLLNNNYEIVDELFEFEITEDYKTYIQGQVDEAFEQIEELYKSIFENNIIYPGNSAGYEMINQLIPTMKYEFLSENQLKYYQFRLPEHVSANLEYNDMILERTKVTLTIDTPDGFEFKELLINGAKVEVVDNKFTFELLKNTTVDVTFIDKEAVDPENPEKPVEQKFLSSREFTPYEQADHYIDENGVVVNDTTENIETELELTMELWGQTRVLSFTVEIGTEQDGFKGTKKFFSFDIDENISIKAINQLIGSEFNENKYENLKELVNENKLPSLDEKPVLEFEYEGHIITFKEATKEDSEEVYEKITVTRINDDLETSDINGTLFQTKYTTNKAQGLEVVDSGIYIADSDNNRIVKLNHNFEVIDAFFGVDDDTFLTHEYRPLKITVDTSERMYVVASGVFEGIIELDSNGDFNRYTGVNPIKLSPFEIFRRMLMTEAQKAKLERFLPTDYSNISLNDKSFIFATAKPREENAEDMIQLINPKGIDVLKRNGYHNPMGDIMFVEGLNNYVIEGPSNLSDIAIGKDGIYSVLDSKRSRIFTYDSEGNLLYVNGDKGEQSDKFSSGIALNYFQDNLVVLDASGTMIVYRPTEFGETVNKAVGLHNDGKFLEAASEWEKVLQLNTNYEIAYNGIGKFNLRDGNYKEAMKNFKLGHDQHYYSKAFKAHRNVVVKENFTWVVITVAVIIAGSYGLKYYLKRKKGES